MTHAPVSINLVDAFAMHARVWNTIVFVYLTIVTYAANTNTD